LRLRFSLLSFPIWKLYTLILEIRADTLGVEIRDLAELFFLTLVSSRVERDAFV